MLTLMVLILLVTFVVGRLCRLDLPEVPAGVFGYALGTFIGTLLFKYWTRLF